MEITVEITEELKGLRLDKALAIAAPEYSRARLQGLLADGQIFQKDKAVVSASRKTCLGEAFLIKIPALKDPHPKAEDIPLDIIFEDTELLVINKSPDMVVHPAPGHANGTLVNALLHHCGDQLSGIGGVRRPGIVHRLDKETSGLMVVAKTDAAHQHLSAQLKDRSLTRVYHCFVWGIPTVREGAVETQLGRDIHDRRKRAVVYGGGKDAVTHYKMLKQFGTLASHVECRLETGRTHQIRVHMAHIKHWLVGDPSYGRPFLQKFLRGRIHLTDELAKDLMQVSRQCLHAAEIGFIHPVSEEYMSFKVDYPEDMQGVHDLLRSMNVKNL